MGAWGAGNFENDTALDWVCELEQATDLGVVKSAIADVLNCDAYLDADQGSTGLAAAEVVAALRDKPPDDLPEEVSAWVQAHSVTPDDALVQDCHKAVARIRDADESELKELWSEDQDSLAEWRAALDGLLARLQ
jgi:hypothetical protein